MRRLHKQKRVSEYTIQQEESKNKSLFYSINKKKGSASGTPSSWQNAVEVVFAAVKSRQFWKMYES